MAASPQLTAEDTRVNPWMMLVVLCLGTVVILLDTTIVNVAIPNVVTSIHASLDEILWVLNAYLLVYATTLVTFGRLGDRFGPRRLFVLGLAVFTAASVLCGLAQSPGQLIAARILQGLGAAALTPQPLVVISAIFPANRRGPAFGLVAGMAGIAAVSGPTLGGLLVTEFNWRWIFFINLPIGLLAIALTYRYIPDVRPGLRHDWDLVGVALLSAGLGSLIFGLIEGAHYDWGRVAGIVTIPSIIALGVVLLLGFLAWEFRQQEPLVPLELFRNRNFTIVTFLNIAISFALFGFLLMFTIDTQSVLAMSPLRAGVTSLPMTLTLTVVAPLAGGLTDKLGGRYLLALGMIAWALGIGLVSWVVSPTSTSWTFVGPLLVTGLGMGFVFAPSVTEAMRSVPPSLAGAASGVLSTVRQVGSVLGVAVIGAVFSARLVADMHEEALRRSSELPGSFRDTFVNGFADAAKRGIEVGSGQAAGVQLPPGVPEQAQPQMRVLIHDVFAQSATAAVQPTMLVVVGVLVAGAAAALLMTSHRRHPASSPEQPATSPR